MNILLVGIIGLIMFDAGLYVFNRVSSNIRNKNTHKIMMRDELRSKLMSKVSELNDQLRLFKENHVSKDDFNELNHKYHILLNQYRTVNNKNKVYSMRLKKLKDKIY